jgi:hypothetical protein
MMSAHRILVLGLAFATTLAAPAVAQEPGDVQPGGVATMVVTVEPGWDSLFFTLTPAEGVRVFSASSGRVATAPGRVTRLPFTFGVPADAGAGRLVVARLTLDGADGHRQERELAVRVVTRRGARFQAADDIVTTAPGAMAEVGYRIRNDGNAADTFHVRLTAPSTWVVPTPVATLVLPAGEEAVGSFRIQVPTAASLGEEHVVRLVAEGADVREVRSARVLIVGDDSRIGNLATVPGSIFLGSAFDEAGATSAVAFHARGEVRPGTRLTLDLRHLEASTSAPALRSAMAGPRMRLALDGSGWSARGGDIISLPGLVQGPSIQGRGVEGTYGLGSWTGEAFVARPWSYMGVSEAGHIVRAGARYRTGMGDFGLRAASVQRDGGLFGGYEQAGAALTYSFRGAGHNVEAEAGAMRVADDGGSVTGMATQLRYALNRGPVSLSARLRTVPGTTSRTASHGNEAFVAGDIILARAVTLTGSAYSTDAPRVDGSPHPESRGATGGFRFRLPAGINSRLMATYRSNEMAGSTTLATSTRALAVGADVPVAGIVLQSDVQLGRTRLGPEDRPYRNARVGARWSQAGQWAWLGVNHYDYGVGGPQTRMELTGATRLGPAELQGGLSARIDDATELTRASVWSGLTVPVIDRTSVSLGVEYRGYMQTSPWRLSMGVGRSMGVPIPVGRVPVVQGVIFEDLDGDGARGAGEPGVPGVVVTLGGLRTRTDADGRFRFYDTSGGPLRVDATSLPRGVTVAPGVELPTRGVATIPVARTASLELRVFLDRGDGMVGEGAGFATGAIATLRDATGTERDAAVDAAGRARFGGVVPGTYVLTIRRPNGRGNGAAFEAEVVLEPGARESMVIGIPYRSLPIRLPNGEQLGPTTAPAVPAPPAEPAVEPTAEPATSPTVEPAVAPTVRPQPRVPGEPPTTRPSVDPAESAAVVTTVTAVVTPRMAAAVDDAPIPATGANGGSGVRTVSVLLLLLLAAAVVILRRPASPRI